MKKIKSYGISKSNDFSGLILGNTAFSYIIASFLLTLFFALITSQYFWKIIWSFRITIITILAPLFIEAILSFIFSFLIFEKKYIIANFNLFQIYEILALIISISKGLFNSFSRILFGILGLFIGLIRVDKNLIHSKQKHIPILNDNLFESYSSLICIYSIFNNPILISSTASLSSSIQNNCTRPKKILKKLWITFLLEQKNSLIKFRKFKENEEKKE